MKTKSFPKFLALIVAGIFSIYQAQAQPNPYCDGSYQNNPMSVSFNPDNNSCDKFSLSTTSSYVNNVCSNTQNLCYWAQPCGLYCTPPGGTCICYYWELYLNNTLIQANCSSNTSNTFTFSNLSTLGQYDLYVSYFRSLSCQSGDVPCEPYRDHGTINITNNVCNSITSSHNNGLQAIIKRSGEIDVNCVIKNNTYTDLTAVQIIQLQSGFNSGTGGTFNARSAACP